MVDNFAVTKGAESWNDFCLEQNEVSIAQSLAEGIPRFFGFVQVFAAILMLKRF